MSELIDRQDAIDRFNVIRPVDPKKDEYTKGIDVGIAMCIVAVKDQPTIQTEKAQLSREGKTKDAISRQQAINALNEYFARIGKLKRGGLTKGEKAISLDTVGIIKTLPPAQPEAQEGHWIEGKIYRDVIECNCSECGQLMTTAASVRMNYCPNCGAKMKGEANE